MRRELVRAAMKRRKSAIISSGLKNEVADDGLYLKASCVSSAEDGSIQFSNNKYLWGAQYTMVLDTSSMRCFRDPSAECLLHKIKHDHQWKWRSGDRTLHFAQALSLSLQPRSHTLVCCASSQRQV